jgi:hypothetical protein
LVTVPADPPVEEGGQGHGAREEKEAGEGCGEGEAEADEADGIGSLEDVVGGGDDVDGLRELCGVEGDGGGGWGGRREESEGILAEGFGV